MKPKQYDNSWLGNMNCLIASRVFCGRKAIVYNGTTRDMSIQAIKNGLKSGAILEDRDTDITVKYRLDADLWPVRIWQ